MKKTFLITAGPTREYIDPVRYLSNASSGLMGYLLAGEAGKRGHKVILVSGPVSLAAPKGVKLLKAVSARDMFTLVKSNISKADVIIAAAAVSDFRPERMLRRKFKKDSGELKLKLVKNPDIAGYAGCVKGGRALVGFCLESENLLERAAKKLKAKNMDLVVANYPSSIAARKTRAWLIDKKGKITDSKTASKEILAKRIIDESLAILSAS
ncbi:MAG TPA: hypothetical protein DEE98_03725 [Elusimicrobia bacterium]|nr:MAG: hypothetical protein A2278_01055 [Elusimicrobia bacterium RIFOXYA12_FULL_49_49]OGS15785.1 MAG: hypothetical protein A2251_03955 [Elusimicrobia bacterium RIFOXYA2_FULL_47_53]OGS25974.1 MAG: hypothetical protein A2339_05350 [Elusimicrobia bacterium RIFOXYB12_FULL_50_12]OGS31118.1 MAG: hypothetical protein A2323_08680 [Elusimicrobia bacterium RIFOXYB2_FULL_46_23]HBU69475.1 hypothetical protein [Elusimicrobiota bacterium]